ncbi:NADPH:quinone reductase [Modicisalibacter ilicicola DSM 19980]|uniref:NADPH:quinone reductase n=1 Tax=Modicisalibacter ilicicola DSM 19980 TaxID=1121942 RepID=A0A1M4SLY5_9GAMM|nr:alcohol dehydrogenase family protein [Halomonas ilicicola]SHE32997.1 NADPH:quinone reductase [Halomonas ilicicola DSM 19980]
MTLPDTMHGIQLTGHGGPEMLQARHDIPVPTPGPGEVLIRVAAAGVNNTDINTRLAWYSKGDGESEDASWSGQALQFPRIQGADVCGEIVAVGEGVSAERIGERVLVEPCLRESGGKRLDPPWYFGSECDGGFAEYTTVAGRHAYRIDSDMSDVELASFPCSYSTAENMLTRARVAQGERVLVTGASGGVGSAAVQLAKARGAHVIAITSAEKVEMLRDLGADEVILRDKALLDAIEVDSIDVVVDLVAGKQWPQYLEVLRRRGRYAVSGAIAGPIVELDVRTLYLKDLSLLGCTVLEPEVFGNLVSHIEQGRIVPLVADSMPLEQIGKAQALFQEKRHVGKIVLEVGVSG